MVKRNQGITLIELMIVIAVVAVIAALAYPSYLNQVRKARQADAKQSLYNIATMLEQYYQDNKGYPSGGDLTNIGLANPYITPEGYYSVQFNGAVTATDYTVRATPIGDQVNEIVCYSYQLTSRGVKTNWDSSDTQINNDRCW